MSNDENPTDLECAQCLGEKPVWIERVKHAEYVTRECVRMLDLMDGYLRDQGVLLGGVRWAETDEHENLRGGYKRIKALADPKGALVHEFEIDQLCEVVEAAKRWHQAPNMIAARDALMDMAAALKKMT